MSIAYVALLLVTCLTSVVLGETDPLLRLYDRHSDVEKECAVFLLHARLGDTEFAVPHQCQDMVRSYLEVEGEKLNVKKECASFLLNAELNNIQGWLPAPECEDYIKSYIEDGQYQADIRVALSAARSFLLSILPNEGVDAVVFDIDETCLSNLPYYRVHHYGVEMFQKSSFNAYVSESKQPVIEAALSLYQELRENKWEIIFITGRDEEARSYTSKNLLDAGYSNWAELILRQSEEEHDSAELYKSNRRAALEKQGYRIRASIGDQWSDLDGMGAAGGVRSFKLPNPMYYIF